MNEKQTRDEAESSSIDQDGLKNLQLSASIWPGAITLFQREGVQCTVHGGRGAKILYGQDMNCVVKT